MKLASLAPALALGLFACGGSAPPPADPSLEDTAQQQGPGSGSNAASAPASNPNVEKAMDAIQSQDFSGAKSILEQARKDDPKDPQAAFYLGVADEGLVGSSRVDLQACKLEYSIVSPK